MKIRYSDDIEVRRARRPGRDALVGMAAGVVGTWAMNRFWSALQSLNGKEEEEGGQDRDGGEGNGDSTVQESAPETAARLVYSTVRGVEPPAPVRLRLATRIHWAQGIAMGGTYGMTRGRAGGADISGGIVFGTALWVVADEVAVPLLGLSEGPAAHPPSEHLEGLGAHLVYGVATAVTAQLLQRVV